MKQKFLIILFLLSAAMVFSADSSGTAVLKSGIDKFTEGRYTEALSEFRDIILTTDYQNLHGTAYYWIARCYMEKGLNDEAADNLDFFLSNFADNPLYSEAFYQKGRLLFQQGDFDGAIQVFYNFINRYSNHPNVSNGYFWIAESLYALGHLEKAEAIYSMIIRNYPLSYKVEASRYKLSLIKLKFREIELLKLLKISHEEYLKALDEFQRREKTYEQTISSYQRRLSSSASDDQKELLEELNTRISEKDSKITSLQNQIKQLNQTVSNMEQQLAAISGADDNPPEVSVSLSTGGNTDIKLKLLELKSTALDLKGFYLNWLSDREGE